MITDSLKIVTFTSGGRPIVLLDLNDGVAYTRIRGSFTYTPAAPTVQQSVANRQYGGSRSVGVVHGNGSVSWQIWTTGLTPQSAAQRAEALFSQIEEVSGTDRYLEWIPVGGSPSYLSLQPPGTWQPQWDPMKWSQAMAVVTTVTLPVLPLVRWAPMTIMDDFSLNSLSDYVFDVGVSGVDVSWDSTGHLNAAATVTAEKRARHTVRGYPLLEGQATIKSTPGATISGYKTGVVLRGSAANTYVEVYVDDNGTNSRLQIDVIIGGTRINRQSTNLVTRISNGTPFWVRGRLVGQVVSAEYWTTAPTATGFPTLAPTGYTLSPSTEQGPLVAGHSGWTWVPQNLSAQLDDFEFRPYARPATTAPYVNHYLDPVPGTAPALADVVIGMGGSSNAIFGLIGWASQSSGSVNSVAVLDSASGTPTVLAEGAQAGAFGGSDARTTRAGGVGAKIALSVISGAMIEWSIPIGAFSPDDFSNSTIDLEVWARVVLANTIVNPMAMASFSIGGTTNTYYSVEYGNLGKSIVPASGTQYRFTRLGIISVDASFQSGKLRVNVACDSGSTGPIGIDYAAVVPARRRAASPTAVAHGSNYPSFLATVGTKIFRSDLSARVGTPPGVARSTGLGGNLIELPTGLVDLLIESRGEVPDDPTATGSTSDLPVADLASSLDVVPRSHLLRNS